MLAVIGTVISSTNSVGAATIQCGATFCPGTEASDTMIGDSNENVMGADNGDDIISGKDAGYTMAGADGNDVMSGGNGDDRMAAV